MSDPVPFLTALAQALGVMSLYPTGHPSRERAIDTAFTELEHLSVPLAFTFLDDQVVVGRRRLGGIKSWDWGPRLVSAGIERIEVERRVNRDELAGFLQDLLTRVTSSIAEGDDAGLTRSRGFRFGRVEVRGGDIASSAAAAAAALEVALGIEAETFRWLLAQVQAHGTIPLLEAEAVVRSLSVTMHGTGRRVLPLLKLTEFDQYTTTHSLNVAVLSMGLAESLGCSSKEVRSIGMAGLLHDVGRARIPLEVLTKPGPLTEDERAWVRRHPVEGAQIIIGSDEDLGMAAAVAYEHHISQDGGGYPSMHYARECTAVSRLVHVCDVYDALSTTRPYRDSWASEKIEAYLDDRAGTEFDDALVAAFLRTLRDRQVRVQVLGDEHA
jgi:putative nucleotidyltransferase with HDIG domain